MYDLQRFWLERRKWPEDFGRWVFLGRAVHEVGAHLFQEQWEETVPAISYEPDKRFSAVQKSIAVAAATGRLVTGRRPTVGGSIKESPAEWWNTEKLHPRFFMCQMKPADPFGNGVAGNGYCWIFVEAEGLSRLINPDAISNAVAGETTLETISPNRSQPDTPAKGALPVCSPMSTFGGAPVAVKRDNAPPVREKMQPGAPGFDKHWWTIEPIVREIYREIEPYDRSVGITQTYLIGRVRERLTQEHPEIIVSDSWLKRRLRGIGL